MHTLECVVVVSGSHGEMQANSVTGQPLTMLLGFYVYGEDDAAEGRLAVWIGPPTAR